MVLRELRQLQISEVGRQRSSAARQDNGQIQFKANQHGVYVQGLLHKHSKGARARIFHAGQYLLPCGLMNLC